MGIEKKELQKKIVQLWQRTRKDLELGLNETSRMLKVGEKYIKEVSEKSKERLELLNLRVKREKLYYKLGKIAANTAKSKLLSDKKAQELLSDIKKLTKEIKKKQKK